MSSLPQFCALLMPLLAALGGCSFNDPPLHDEWRYKPVRMDGARLPAEAEGAPRELRDITRQQWDSRAQTTQFRNVTASLMWSNSGIYGIIHGARINDVIQFETSSTGMAPPEVRIWLGTRRELIHTAETDRTATLSRPYWSWDWPPGEVDGQREHEDRFFLSWSALGVRGPPGGSLRVGLHLAEVGLLNTVRGGAWLAWGVE